MTRRVAVPKNSLAWTVSLLREESVAILRGDIGVDLIAGDTIQGRDVAGSQSLCRWNNLENDVGHLEKIVEDLRKRDRASRKLTDHDDGPIGDSYLYPMPQDAGIYRVRVRVRTVK
jgi:hypothetical protein